MEVSTVNGGGGRARRLTRRLAAKSGTSRQLRVRRSEPGAPPPGDRFTTAARMRWLNEASTSIGTTLDLERTAEELAAYSVPGLADAAAVDLLESVLRGEEGERVTGAAVPVTRAMAVRSIAALEELEPSPVGQVVDRRERRETLLTTECLRNGRPVLVSRMTPQDYKRVAPTDSAEAAMRRQGVHSYLAVPLTARGVLLGSADFVRAGDRRPFNRADLELASQLASIAAVFIDNARLYGREREHVVSLQRSLLPRATPRTPGLTVHAHYAPAVDAHGVGGDWYDVVALPSGRTALVVGDVTGHGLPAAATMGRLRAVARTLMMLDITPDRLLARLDLATRDLEDDQVATCLCAVYDPADSSYTIASAGHPPPLLVDADGTARYVDVPAGAPLGAGVIPYDPLRVRGPAGGRLVFYTDGLVKTRTDDVDVQLEGLRDSVARMAPERLDAGGPLTSPRRDDGRFDEAVLLVAGGHELPPGVRLREWDLPSEGNSASTARRLVTEQLARWELADLADVTELVVSELVGNALRYGGGPGRLRLLLCDDRLQVELADTGPDLPQIQHADVSDEGGRGLQLINLLCRSWGSCRTATGKIVWAEQDVPRGGAAL
ncbi:SpoIIE family protein phosphatase [Streptomyces sp. NPDC047973]|uniref:ATP-binding SpoIIE family protein phosphatase n=1 Tax=Streptomyces sp. NPDC047973 TaxID=3155383 RepID=UPI0034151957